LRTQDLDKYLKYNLAKLGVKYLGCKAADQWPSSIPHNQACAFVSNSHCQERPGEHWLAIYINDKRKPFYFDSYGMDLPHKANWIEFFNTHCRGTLEMFNKTIQKDGTNWCGYFCIYYLLYKAANPHIKDELLMRGVSGLDAYNFVHEL
jgi:hypothetical protein